MSSWSVVNGISIKFSSTNRGVSKVHLLKLPMAAASFLKGAVSSYSRWPPLSQRHFNTGQPGPVLSLLVWGWQGSFSLINVILDWMGWLHNNDDNHWYQLQHTEVYLFLTFYFFFFWVSFSTVIDEQQRWRPPNTQYCHVTTRRDADDDDQELETDASRAPLQVCF